MNTITQIGYLLILPNPGNQIIGSMSPKWYDYPEIINDLRGHETEFPEASQFEIEFKTESIASFNLNDKTLHYDGFVCRQNESKSHIIIDNVYKKIINGNFNLLSGDIETFLFLKPGFNELIVQNVSYIKVRFRPMYA